MSIYGRMVHRFTSQRDANLATYDARNNAQTPSWQAAETAEACYYYQPSVRQRGEQRGDVNVNLYTHQMLVMLTADVAEGDQVTAVMDRRGSSVESRTLRIVQVVRKPNHQLVTMEVIA